jgi:hypothetical protein
MTGLLDHLELPALESLFRDAPLGPLPAGVQRGQVLRYLQTPGARRPHLRAVDWLLFDLPRFGIDFNQRRWWFLHPRLAAGHFDWSPGRSRWRDTEVLRLTYGGSRLPGAVRSMLYDELKPLADGRCLGIGGVNAGPGEGEHFFFSLTPLAPGRSI